MNPATDKKTASRTACQCKVLQRLAWHVPKIKLNNWSQVMKRFLLAVIGWSLVLTAQAGCYSVYSSAGRLIHQSIEAPVDTTYQYHLTVPQRFGAGATLVYQNGEKVCPTLSAAVQTVRAQFNTGGPIGPSQAIPKADRG